MRTPADAQRVIVDTPAGVRAHETVKYLRGVNTILVPVLASIIDVEASIRFVHDLQKVVIANGIAARIVVVANRVKPRSPMHNVNELFAEMGVPVVGRLMDSISYLKCAEQGIGMDDLSSRRARAEHRRLTRLVAKIDDIFEPGAQANIGDNRDMTTIATDSVSEVVGVLPQAAGQHYSLSWK